MAEDDKQVGPERVLLCGEPVAVDPTDMTFRELDEVHRLLRLIPNWITGRSRETAYAFVTLKRDATFAAWDDEKFLSLKPSDLVAAEGANPPEA